MKYSEIWEEKELDIIRISEGPLSHFFGYYDKSPWNSSDSILLGMEAPNIKRIPLKEDVAKVGIIDPSTKKFISLAETKAWNWQQGCMLQWISESKVIFNSSKNEEPLCIILDIKNRKTSYFPFNVAAVAPGGKWGIALNFGRLAKLRPIVGYGSIKDHYSNIPLPDNDGLWYVDLESGDKTLILSLKQSADILKINDSHSFHRFEHVCINPSGTRLFVLHRWEKHTSGRPFYDRMLTINPDGSEPYPLLTDEYISHFSWMDDEWILVWAKIKNTGPYMFLVKDKTQKFIIEGENILIKDGHCSFSPDRRWILLDTYPDEKWFLNLLLYNRKTKKLFNIARFKTNQYLYKIPGIRCDLHPRWNHSGTKICIDAPQEDSRQMFIVDVEQLVKTS